MTKSKFRIDKKSKPLLCPHITERQGEAGDCDMIGFVNNKTQILEQYFLMCNADGQCGIKLHDAMVKTISNLKEFTAISLKKGEWSILP